MNISTLNRVKILKIFTPKFKVFNRIHDCIVHLLAPKHHTPKTESSIFTLEMIVENKKTKQKTTTPKYRVHLVAVLEFSLKPQDPPQQMEFIHLS